jgi:hypothetical protein
MRVKTTHVICNSQDPESRPAVQLSPLAIEDLTGEPVFSLTPTGLAELALEDAKSITLTPHLVKRLAEFKAAREAREQAPKGELGKAIAAEDAAALNLAWALENLVNQESAS